MKTYDTSDVLTETPKPPPLKWLPLRVITRRVLLSGGVMELNRLTDFKITPSVLDDFIKFNDQQYDGVPCELNYPIREKLAESTRGDNKVLHINDDVDSVFGEIKSSEYEEVEGEFVWTVTIHDKHPKSETTTGEYRIRSLVEELSTGYHTVVLITMDFYEPEKLRELNIL